MSRNKNTTQLTLGYRLVRYFNLGKEVILARNQVALAAECEHLRQGPPDADMPPQAVRFERVPGSGRLASQGE